MSRSDTRANAPRASRTPADAPGVLIADDDPLLRAYLQRELEDDGFVVWTAKDGREAIDLYRARRESVAVLLLDVQMPGVGGPQALAALRCLDAGIPCCLMSGDFGRYSPDELRQTGADAFLPKPFSAPEATRVLRGLCRDGRRPTAG